jgi:hypothetical protein
VPANPAVFIGDAALFGSPALPISCPVSFSINLVYFVLHEEPGLERRFGEEYRACPRSAPSWAPRRTLSTPGLARHSAARVKQIGALGRGVEREGALSAGERRRHGTRRGTVSTVAAARGRVDLESAVCRPPAAPSS